MEWSTVIFLGMAMASLVTLMGIIIFGTRRSNEMKEVEKMIAQKAQALDSNSDEIKEALKKSEEENEKMLQRLQNLEAIVTSEAWESIKAGKDEQQVQLHIDEEEAEDLSDADKVAKISKRVR